MNDNLFAYNTSTYTTSTSLLFSLALHDNDNIILYIYKPCFSCSLILCRMKVLNLSNNRLSELPNNNNNNGTDDVRQQKNRKNNSSSLEKLYLTGNSLTNTALDALAKFGSLRVLHLAYNALDIIPEM